MVKFPLLRVDYDSSQSDLMAAQLQPGQFNTIGAQYFFGFNQQELETLENTYEK